VIISLRLSVIDIYPYLQTAQQTNEWPVYREKPEAKVKAVYWTFERQVLEKMTEVYTLVNTVFNGTGGYHIEIGNIGCLNPDEYTRNINYALHLFIGVYYVTTCAVGVIGNLLVLATVVHQNSLHGPSYYLLCNLAVGDLMYSLIILPTYFTMYFTGCFQLGHIGCQIQGYVSQSVALHSLWTLAFISIDRYHAICNSLSYTELFTVRKCYAMIVLSWAIPFLTNAFPYVGWGQYHLVPYCFGCFMAWGPTVSTSSFSYFVGLSNFYPAVLIYLWCYIKIFREAKKTIATTPSVAQDNNLNCKWKADLKASKTFAIIMGLFLCSWFPFVGCRVTKRYMEPTFIMKVVEEVTLFTLTAASYINPCVYCLMNRGFRGKLMIVLGIKSNQIYS